MRQDVRRNPREGAKGRPAGQNYSQLNRSTQQNRRGTGTAGQRPLARQSQNSKRQPGRDWPNRLEAERAGAEKTAEASAETQSQSPQKAAVYRCSLWHCSFSGCKAGEELDGGAGGEDKGSGN